MKQNSSIQRVYATVVMKNNKKFFVIKLDNRKKLPMYDNSLYFENLGAATIGYARKLEIIRSKKTVESYKVINPVEEYAEREPVEIFKFKNSKKDELFCIKAKDLKVRDLVVFEWELSTDECEFLRRQFNSRKSSTNDSGFRTCVHMFFIQRIALYSDHNSLQTYFTIFLQSI